MTINNFSVSVCMATYNGEEFVKEQIKSIIDQFSNIKDELIIVDDNSKDGVYLI